MAGSRALGPPGEPTHPAPCIRDASAGRRGGHPSGPGAAGARQPGDDAALHARLARPAVRRLSLGASASMTAGPTSASQAPPDALGALWKDYKASGSPKAREQLILHYSPLVKYVASRLA